MHLRFGHAGATVLPEQHNHAETAARGRGMNGQTCALVLILIAPPNPGRGSSAGVTGVAREFATPRSRVWRQRAHPTRSGFGHSQRATGRAASAPRNCAAMKAGAPDGAMPANVSVSDRASVTAGLANDVEAVNQ